MAQLGSIDVTVVVPPSTPLTPATPQPVPQTGQPPGLAFTGIDAGVLLLMAIVLVAVGVALHRLTRRAHVAVLAPAQTPTRTEEP